MAMQTPEGFASQAELEVDNHPCLVDYYDGAINPSGGKRVKIDINHKNSSRGGSLR